MKNITLITSLVLLLANPSVAWAVDGVGLFEFFPPLEWLMWLIQGTIAVLVLKHGIFSKSIKVGVTRRIGASALVALLVLPILFAVLSPYYVRILCAEATLEVGVKPSTWVPRSPIMTAQFTSKLDPKGEVETNTIPGLLDYYGREGGTLGIWIYRHRLVEQSTGRTLLSARYFGSRRTGPMVCEAARDYWRFHKEFERIAFDAAR